jgi:hypothetical protein
MKLIVSIVFACFCAPCWGEEPVSEPEAKIRAIPTLEKQESPATLLKKNPDGTLLVSLRPQVYLDELGCVMVSDGNGNTFPRMHHVIAFSLEKIRYWTIWGTSPGGGPPVKLDPKTDYKCLIKTSNPIPEGVDLPCSILKIWDGGNLIFERKEKAEQAEAPNRR